MSTGESKELVTNPALSDGFCAQFQTIIYAIIFAEQQNKTFVYTPFQRMEHNYTADPDFLAKKEWLVNLRDTFPINIDLSRQTISAGDFIRYFESHLEACAKSPALIQIKRLFRSNKERPFDQGHYHIAVHVRRHNSQDNRIDGTNTPDAVYLSRIARLLQKFAGRSPR